MTTTISAARRRLGDLQTEAAQLAATLAEIEAQGEDGCLSALEQAHILIDVDAIAERLMLVSEAVAVDKAAREPFA